MKLTAPYVNLNGNDKDTLLSEIWDVVQSINATIEKVARCDYSDGRNSRDNNHRIEMAKDKRRVVDQLHGMKDGFVELYNEINKY